MNKIEKSIGIRVKPETYDSIISMCGKLGDIPVNNFAQNSIESALEMLKNKELTVPKWIAVQRFALDFDKGEKLK
jgi:hypothetical protein